MRGVFILLCSCLLPLFAFADGDSDVTLRLVEATYRPGDVIELQAEMRRSEYAEFELHVPAQPQLHFMAHTREPVRYVDGHYVQRVLLLLQPMGAGAFELDAVTASVQQGEAVTVVQLPSLAFSVASYGAEDASKDLAVLLEDAPVVAKRPLLVWGLAVLVGMIGFVWFFMRKQKPMVEEYADTEGLSDLVVALDAGTPASDLIERLLSRDALALSSSLRESLEAAVYANRIDEAALLRQLKEEVKR